MENRNIINNNANSEKSFFTPKKIIIYSIITIVFCVFIFLIYKFIFDIDFNTITSSISNSYNNNNLFFLWLFLLLIFPFYNCLLRVIPYKYKLKQRGIYVKWYDWIIFCFITFFIGAITPFAMGSEPYIMYWLKKKGLQLKEATAIVASFTVINPFIQVLITWPSFFIICASYSANSNNPGWIGSFWSVFVGLMFDLIGTFFWFIMSISRRAHYILNLFIAKIKKIFKMKYKSKEEIKEEYIKNSSFRKLFMAELRDKKFVIILSIGSLIWNILYYSSLIFAFNFIDPSFRFNAFDLFNYANIATTANNFIPIPGAEGTLQAVLILFIENSTYGFNGTHEELKIICTNSVFIWRTFSFYITAFPGILAFIYLCIRELFFYIRRNKREKPKYI